MSERPVVVLVLEVEPPDRLIADNLVLHLKGELEAREIDVCTASSSPRKPIAYVRLHVTRTGSGVSALIEVRDEVTDKKIERTLDLSNLPAETRPLVVATATDELLRVSWTELTIGDAPAPKMTPPPAVIHAVETQPRRFLSPPADRFLFAAETMTSAFFGHRNALGVGARFGVALPARFLVDARLGFEHGFPRDSGPSSTRADAVLAGSPWSGRCSRRTRRSVRDW